MTAISSSHAITTVDALEALFGPVGEASQRQCARAIARSNLWAPVDPSAPRPVPTPGQMLEALTQAGIDGETCDAGLAERQRGTLH